VQKLDEVRTSSDEDYGVFTCVGTLFVDVDGTHWLQVKCGYSKPYDESWYKLGQRPAKSLEEAFTVEAWADTYSDQSEVFAADLGVECVKQEPPL